MNAARLLLAACFIGSVVANTTLLAGEWLRVVQPSTPGLATLVYDPATGELNVNGGGRALTTYEVVSANQRFDVSTVIVCDWWCPFPDTVGQAFR